MLPVAVAALLCACALPPALAQPAPWPVHGANRLRTGASTAIGPGASLALDFSTPVNTYLNNYPPKVAVGYVNNTEVVFFGDNGGGLTCLNTSSRKVLWRFATAGLQLAMYSQPAVSQALGLVFWGQYDGFMRAIRFDGSLAWKLVSPSGLCGAFYCSIDASPLLSDDGLTLYFAFTEPATFAAADARTGALLFNYTVGTSSSSGGELTGAGVLRSERLAALARGVGVGVTASTPSTLTSPALSSTHAYYATQATVFAFSAVSKALSWQYACGVGGASNSGPYGFAVSDNSSSLFTACFDASFSYVVALHSFTGALKWRTPVDARDAGSSYAYTFSRVALGPGNRVFHVGFSALYALDGATGALLWRLPLPLPAGTSVLDSGTQPSLGADGLLYLMLQGLGLLVVDGETGTQVNTWSASDWDVGDRYLGESVALAPATAASGGRPRVIFGARLAGGAAGVFFLSGTPYKRLPAPDPSLSAAYTAAGIAGIMVGSLAAVALVAWAAWVFFRPAWLPHPPCLPPKAVTGERAGLLA
jgi:outer membrane protein assembly factor BamB